jgi:hypothetical protein
MEGVELHATVDGRGVHWFDTREVDAIAVSSTQGAPNRVGVDHWQRYPVHGGLEPSAEADDSVRAICATASHATEAFGWAAQARAHARAVHAERERVASCKPEVQPAQTAADLDLARARQVLINELANCSDRLLRRLTRREVDQILELLGDLD